MRVLVTGGGGFLGRRIVELLRERGDQVVFLARGRYPEVEATGATGLQVDLRDADGVRDAAKGCDVVLHVAAKAGYWGSRDDYWATNVDGTQHVIDACRAQGVGRLVYTGTPSVVGYDHDTSNGGPDLPYAEVHRSFYPASKAEAERRVLAANGQGLATVALRPHLIFGPRDLQLMPRVIDRARVGKLPIVGDGDNLVDMTYVDNAAWAHLDAIDALGQPDAACAGSAYFISNDEPVALWHWIGDFVEALGVPRPTRKISLGSARLLGAIMEFLWRWLPLPGEPRMTRFLADGFARAHWYDMGPAQRELGYSVRVSMDDATARTLDFYRSVGS